ncbi:Uncharacterised protein [uncultured archaeon]|nr:Uncharacterised protein [uncultured archaeon]
MVKFYNKTLSEALVLALWLHIGTLLALTSFIIITTLLTGLIGTPLLLFGLDKFNFVGNAAMLLIAFFLILPRVLRLFQA